MAEPGVASNAPAPRPTTWPRALVLGAVCVELGCAVVEKGAFFAPWATVTLVSSLVLLALTYGLSRESWAVRPEDVALLALALWWCTTARLHSVGASFEPLGASVVGFVAAAAAFRSAPERWRRAGAHYLVAGASVTAVVGLVACDLRWFPIAARAQDLWRLSSTLTYANAAGLLLAVGLLLATDRSLWGRGSPLAVAACAAGLVATESRAAVLGAVLAFAWLARRELLEAAVPMAVGVLAGLVTVASASGDTARPLALAATLALVAVAPIASKLGGHVLQDRRGARPRRLVLLVGGALVLLVVVAVVGAHDELVRRVDLGSDTGRVHEWRAALAQFRSSVWTGVGPDQPLALPGGASTYFAHDEYLQVLAGGGLVGAALLAGAVALSVRAVRGATYGLSTARGALVVVAVGGVFDYSWHLPAIGLLGGATLGLAQRGRGAPSVDHDEVGRRTRPFAAT